MAGPDKADARQAAPWQRLIGLDQVAAAKRNIRAAIPVNIIISSVILLVAVHYGEGVRGWLWFAASCLINAIRFVQSWFLPAIAKGATFSSQRNIARHLHFFCFTALISGCVWAFIPALCDFYAGPQTLFYLTVVCGVTAGAITQGAPYTPIPISFIVPPLLSIFCCLIYTGSFEHYALAATVLAYTVALIRFARQSEAGFMESSRLKNEAVALAQSLHEAHAHTMAIADQMTHRAAHDGLTGLFNRSGFMQVVEARLNSEKSAFCLMLLDLDGFKSVNDVYGHHAGDRVLVEVARRLSQALTEEFTLARLGGDEFAIFYDLSATEILPPEFATRLVTSIAVPFALFDVGRLGACIGVYIGRGRSAPEMLTCADEALYAAKTAGRNRHYIFDDILRERSEMRRDIERDLPRALSENEVELWYQPVFSQNPENLRQPVSLEALLRWRHPRHGLVPPEEVIMVAAMAGLAEALLRYVFKQICAMLDELRLTAFAHIPVAMNISPREISRLPIDEILLAGLQDFDLPASLLEIEITEESALDIRSVQDKLLRLARSGIKITIDDFGVGYSSLGTLRQSYISKIKIDYSFIRGVAKSPENQILVQAILNLGRSLNVQVVAEGVENAEDLAWLEHTGGDLLQGYYLKSPTTKTAIIEWMQELASTPPN